MGAAWPEMPPWLGLAATPATLRRGEAVRLRWAPGGDGHELRLALVVHQKVKLSTLELDVPGQFGSERQLWSIADRAAVDSAGEGRLRVPADGPYSYPGTVLAFFWGVALARPADVDGELLGWSALRVLP